MVIFRGGGGGFHYCFGGLLFLFICITRITNLFLYVYTKNVLIAPACIYTLCTVRRLMCNIGIYYSKVQYLSLSRPAGLKR